MNVTLVTGATGNVGSRVVRELRARGAVVRAFVRDRDEARRLLGYGIELAAGDFSDAASVRRAMDGVRDVFLACPNHPKQYSYEAGVVDAAADAGVRRFVKLSTAGAGVGSTTEFLDVHGRLEEYVRRAIPGAVVLRPTFYMTNLLAFAGQIRQLGKFFAPAGAARIAMIDPLDVAAVAAIALTTGRHEGETLALTGRESITFVRVAEELSAVTGGPVDFVDVPDDVARDGLTQAGLPPWLALNITRLYAELRAGVAAETTDAVRLVTGREPRTVAHFLRAHGAAFGCVESVGTRSEL